MQSWPSPPPVTHSTYFSKRCSGKRREKKNRNNSRRPFVYTFSSFVPLRLSSRKRHVCVMYRSKFDVRSVVILRKRIIVFRLAGERMEWAGVGTGLCSDYPRTRVLHTAYLYFCP